MNNPLVRTTHVRFFYLLSAAMMFFGIEGCGSDNKDDDTGADSDSDSDTSSDADSDGDTETDTDTQDTDTGTDTENDTGTEDDTDTDTDTGEDTDTNLSCTDDSACAGVGLICNENWGICVVSNCASKDDFTPCETTTDTDRSYDICINGECKSPGCGDATCNPPGPHFRLADTNQRFCSEDTNTITCTTFPCDSDGLPDFCGQDAQYGWDVTHDTDERFTRDTTTVADNPVVTDNVTGLIWQGCAAGATSASCTAGAPENHTWAGALAYCDGLNWGGFDDWRLPDPYELDSIVDSGSYIPSIDTDAFPQTPSSVFWSSSSFASNLSGASDVRFSYGFAGSNGKTTDFSVRCVRGGPMKSRHFDISILLGERAVIDTATGLQWQGCARGLSGNICGSGSATTSSWSAALSYCESLTWAGYTDWRLPDRKELLSIVDAGTFNPAIDTTAFPTTPSDFFWSSSSFAYNISNAWSVRFDNGNVINESKAVTHYARCVRGGL